MFAEKEYREKEYSKKFNQWVCLGYRLVQNFYLDYPASITKIFFSVNLLINIQTLRAIFDCWKWWENWETLKDNLKTF